MEKVFFSEIVEYFESMAAAGKVLSLPEKVGREFFGSVAVAPASGRKCDRCWMYTDDGVGTEDGGWLCDRCRAAL